MLAYAFRYFRFNMFEQIRGEKFEGMEDLFAEILIRGVSYQLKQGLYRTYVSDEGALTAIRGRIYMIKTREIQQQNPPSVYCEYDELSENNIYNQVLKATLQLLSLCANVNDDRKAAMRILLRFFAHVDTVDLEQVVWGVMKYDRNNQNYQMLVNICRFIREEMIMTTEEGEYKLRSLSEDRMERLFEKFVLEYYRRWHPETKPRAARIGWNIIESESTMSVLPAMQTDVVLSFGDRTLIIDTKYYSQTLQSNFDKEKIHSNNLYQINTYVTEHDRYGVGNVDGLLLYAKTQENIIPDAQMKKKNGSIIYFRTLDLNQDFQNISQQLDNIVNIMRQ